MEASGQTSILPDTSPINPAPSEFKKIPVNKTNFTTLYDGPDGDGKGVIVE